MAQTYNFDGTKLVIPGSYIKTKVLNENAGVAATGIIALIGEADSGPAYSDLTVQKIGLGGQPVLADSGKNRVAFTPDEGSLVEGMFGSGRLVDAFNAISAPFNGINALTGTPSLVYVIKTNAGTKSSFDFNDNAGTPALLCKFKAKSSGSYGDETVVRIATKAADSTTGLVPVTVSFQRGIANDPAQEFNNTAVFKLESGTGVTITVAANKITVGGVDYLFSNYKTVNDLMVAINGGGSGATFTVYDKQFKFLSPKKLLDIGDYSLSGSNTKYIGALGWQLANASFQLVDVSDVSYIKPVLTASLARPDAKLTGGAKGSTSDEDILAALKKAGLVSVNFVVPLFSQDAADDIVAGQTDEDSDYTLDKVIEYSLKHCNDSSSVKSKKNRQAYLSHNGTYASAHNLVSDNGIIANTPYEFRGSLAFQGVIKDGTEYQPWMVATLAAAAQAVAGYRPIFNKGLNVQGVINPADYDGSTETQEAALQYGLLTLADSDNGIDTIFLSDQTTYLFPDNNFVYNSIQAVYGADVISLTLQQQMQKWVGQSNADVTPGVAVAYAQSILGNLLVNKWIASSSDAPNGYKNLKVSINGPVMNMSVEAKESTGIYFVPINLSISMVKN